MAIRFGDRAARLLSTRIGATTATTTTMRAIAANARDDGMIAIVLADSSLWVFDLESAAGASSTVLVPDAGDGRWLKFAVADGVPSATLALTTSGNGGDLVGLYDSAGNIIATTVGGAIREFAPKMLALQVGAANRVARAVVTSNVADLAAFVVSQDGVTLAAGDIVLLPNQTTAAQCGLYVLGTVAGTAPLTRVADLFTGASYVNGCTVEISEGTVWKGSTWKSMATGAKVVGTHDPLFYPKTWKKLVTLVAGTVTLASADDMWLFSASTSVVHAFRNTANTTTLTTGGYTCPAATRTAGKKATASIVVFAAVAAGTINVADESTLDVIVTNF